MYKVELPAPILAQVEEIEAATGKPLPCVRITLPVAARFGLLGNGVGRIVQPDQGPQVLELEFTPEPEAC